MKTMSGMPRALLGLLLCVLSACRVPEPVSSHEAWWQEGQRQWMAAEQVVSTEPLLQPPVPVFQITDGAGPFAALRERVSTDPVTSNQVLPQGAPVMRSRSGWVYVGWIQGAEGVRGLLQAGRRLETVRVGQYLPWASANVLSIEPDRLLLGRSGSPKPSVSRVLIRQQKKGERS